MKRLAVLLMSFLLVELTSQGGILTLAQGTTVAGVRYFPATGHNIQGDFLAFFERHGGEAILGLPRTEEFLQDSLKVQYFQRVRMEYHPYNPQPYQVQLALLGDLLGYRAPAIPASSIPAFEHPQRRYYPETGHTLSYSFLTYYDTHGGLDVFGYPITELMAESGTVVQHFQRGKMEWHPENAIDQQVTLGNLGDEYLARIGLPSSYLQAVAPALARPAPALPDAPEAAGSGQPVPAPLVLPSQADATEFSVSAWVKYPITGQGGSQTVYARVLGSMGQGVPAAQVEVAVHFRAGDQIFRATNTDAAGYSSLTFHIGYPPPGYTVIVDVRVAYAGRMVTTQTSFIPWW